MAAERGRARGDAEGLAPVAAAPRVRAALNVEGGFDDGPMRSSATPGSPAPRSGSY
ncbi:hypothetical protein ACFYZN_21665 [Streptomyces sp. NPDC001777]|uniref:hypothetical protein n=1 Tax=Streptomyces sp. NPDC001777 TaxID=3364608 RepID=UPI0036987751